METIEKIEQDIIDEFSVYDDWMDKYAYLIEIGTAMPAMEEQYKRMSVPGMVSRRNAGKFALFYGR